MGLRERNAAQTRELILSTALDLFLEHGYEATKMEDIAERAEIGTSTLYRYFPTKDALVLEPLALHGQMAAELRSRPVDEPLDLALGHALRVLLSTPRVEPARLRQIVTVLESAAGPQARILEDFAKERALLAQAIAERVGRPADDLYCVMTARVTTDVLEVISGLQRAATDSDPADAVQDTLDLATQVLENLRLSPPVLPRVEPAQLAPGR